MSAINKTLAATVGLEKKSFRGEVCGYPIAVLTFGGTNSLFLF